MTNARAQTGVGGETAGVLTFGDFPPAAAWRHQGARAGFEVACFAPTEDGWRVTGRTSALEDGVAWSVGYTLDINHAWVTRHATIDVITAEGSRLIELDGDGEGSWTLDGVALPHVAGCLDVDLESSSMTNTLPVHRLAIGTTTETAAPAVYVRAADLTVERLEQTYRREPDAADTARYDYTAPVFDTRCTLVYDRSGLVLDYPGIAVRVC